MVVFTVKILGVDCFHHGTGAWCAETGLWEVVVAASNSAAVQHSSTSNTPLPQNTAGPGERRGAWLCLWEWG